MDTRTRFQLKAVFLPIWDTPLRRNWIRDVGNFCDFHYSSQTCYYSVNPDCFVLLGRGRTIRDSSFCSLLRHSAAVPNDAGLEPWTEVFFATAILSNSLLIGVQVHYAAQSIGQPQPTAFFIVEQMLALWEKNGEKKHEQWSKFPFGWVFQYMILHNNILMQFDHIP